MNLSDAIPPVAVPLRTPFQHAGLRYAAVEVRTPTPTERQVMRLSIAAAIEMHKPTGELMCRMIANFCDMPESAVDEMACDDADRVFHEIARTFRAAKEQLDAAV